MKNFTSILVIVTSIWGCAPKQKPLAVYILKVEREVLNLAGTRFDRETQTDTIRAADDTVAYFEAVKAYYSHKVTENTSRYNISKTLSFTIQDDAGFYLDMRLPEKTTDSIDNLVETISRKLEDDLKQSVK